MSTYTYYENKVRDLERANKDLHLDIKQLKARIEYLENELAKK